MADNTSDDGPRPLRIIIVGAGIGGLTAAIALRQQGHEVGIYEQSKLAQETGAAIHLAPNANGLLRRFGLYVENIGAVECKGITEFKPDGSLKYSIDLSQANKMWAHPWHLVHRAHLHTALKDMAIGEKGKGRPARLHVSSRVKSVDPSAATVLFEDGSEVQGDLIVGADGVHSSSRTSIPGGDLKPFDSGKSAFRFLIPTETLMNDPNTRPFVEKDDFLSMWIGTDRRVVMYPCVNKTVMNFVGIHPSAESAEDTKGGGWQETGSKTRMLQIFESFGSGVTSILDKADEGKIKVWALLDMDKMPSFIEGRLAVVGDAAHPFLPHQGQGGGQAMEDATSLGALLPLGTRPEDIPDRLKLYNECRYTRAHRIQEYTRLAGRDADEFKAEGKQLDMYEYTAYNFGHDEWDASSHALQKHLETHNGAARYRTPYGFGPSPGPRLPLSLDPTSAEVVSLRQRCPERRATYAIRFRSSRTYLQNLLPPGFAFTSPGTNVAASISCTNLEGMTWLGGGGYSHLGLYIHGVNYTKQDGSKVFGTYIAVLFENMADPIITGRDEVGFPKAFADIDVREGAGTGDHTISLSWRGFEFGKFKIKDLKTPETSTNGIAEGASQPARPGPGSPPPPPDQGQIFYRYVPAVGEVDKTDAEYAVLCPYPPQEATIESMERLETKSAGIEFQALDWQRLPTLHHISRTLAGMPIYGIEKAEMIKGTQVDDFSNAIRI